MTPAGEQLHAVREFLRFHSDRWLNRLANGIRNRNRWNAHICIHAVHFYLINIVRRIQHRISEMHVNQAGNMIPPKSFYCV
jgi:hypothetical protein